MGYRLGVDLGTTYTAAVIHRPGSAPTVVPLGDRAAMMPSVLFLGADGSELIGEAAERRAVTEPDRVVRRFKRRIGDETPLLVGAKGNGLTAHAIAARMIALVADRVAEQEGGAPEAVAVTVPASWAAHKKELLSGALVREGLLGVDLISEPTAAALAYAHTGRLGPGTTVAVYDFGGGTFDAALLRAEEGQRFRPLGSPSGLPNLGGIDFDDAVLAYVLGTVGPQTPGLDLEDPAHVAAMSRLRRECVDAKEALSADSAVTVPVLIGGVATTVRLTRGEFEAMIAGAVEETCTAVEAALVSAGLTRKNLDRILLVGGSSRIPLVTQLLSARYPGVALDRDIDPKLAVATGAVLALELPGAAGARGRHAAPSAGADPELATALTPVAAAVPAPVGRPERPAIEREAFDREPGTVVVQQKKRRTPLVLGVAAGMIMTSGFALSLFGHLEFHGTLPSATLQEAHADAKPDKSAQLQTEAVGDSNAKTGGSDSTDKSASTGTSGSSGSAGTASGRTEGSAHKRATDTGKSDVSSAGATSDKSGATPATKDQASADRKAARGDGAAKPGTGSTASARVTPATGEVAPAAAPAQPAASPAEDTSTDSGSIEAFNDGSPGGDPASPPSGP
jgi:hypothetical protein